MSSHLRGKAQQKADRNGVGVNHTCSQNWQNALHWFLWTNQTLQIKYMGNVAKKTFRDNVDLAHNESLACVYRIVPLPYQQITFTQITLHHVYPERQWAYINWYPKCLNIDVTIVDCLIINIHWVVKIRIFAWFAYPNKSTRHQWCWCPVDLLRYANHPDVKYYATTILRLHNA